MNEVMRSRRGQKRWGGWVNEMSWTRLMGLNELAGELGPIYFN